MIEVGSCLFSEFDADGFLGIQYDGNGGINSGVPTFPAYQPLGFLSVPQDPDESGSAACYIFTSGEEMFILPSTDSRASALIPHAKKGSAVQYAVRKGFKLLSFDLHDGETGNKVVYVEYQDEGEKKAHILTMGVDANGKPIIEFVHGNGMGISCIDKSAVFRNASGSVYISVDDTRATINGDLKVNGSISATSGISSDGEVTANAGSLPTTLSKHLHPTAMGPSGPPTPGT